MKSLSELVEEFQAANSDGCGTSFVSGIASLAAELAEHPEGEWGDLLDRLMLQQVAPWMCQAARQLDGEPPQLSQDALFSALGILLKSIEDCGASPELTRAVTLASDIRRAVGDRHNKACSYAADRVRAAFTGH